MNSEDHFDAIVREHYEPLFRFAMHLTRAEHDAKDLTQQTFYVWATKGHQLRDASKLRTWLFTTLHNVFLKERRRQARFIHEDLESAAQLPAPRTEFENQGDGSAVLAALAQVDEIYRAAVSLFYLRQCSYQEIVIILKIPIGTVKSRIARGIAQLRAILLLNETSVRLSVADEAPLQFDELGIAGQYRVQLSLDAFELHEVERDLSSSRLPGTSSRLWNHTRSLPHSAVN